MLSHDNIVSSGSTDPSDQSTVVTSAATPADRDDSVSNVVSIETARLRRLVAGLPKRHRLIIGWRYGLDGLTLNRREIAGRLRLSPTVVCRTEREALRLLHDRALSSLGERDAA